MPALTMLARGVRVAPLLLGAGLLGACGDATAPETEFDPRAAAASLESVLSAAEGEADVFASLRLAGAVLASQGVASAVLVPGDGPWSGLLPRPDIVRRAELAAPLFPSNLLGCTLVFDPDAGQYVVDETAEGAPENGVRFIYYAIDPVTGLPVEPLIPLGNMDLTDESGASSVRLGVEVVSTAGVEPVTRIDYFVDAAYSVVSNDVEVRLTAEGFLADGSDRLVFHLSQSATVADGAPTLALEIDHALELPDQGVTVSLAARGRVLVGSDATTEFSASLTIASVEEEVVIDVTQVGEDGIEGTVTYAGAVAIVIDGTQSQPVFTRPDGEPIGEAEIQALMFLRDSFENVLDFAEAIFSVFDDES